MCILLLIILHSHYISVVALIGTLPRTFHILAFVLLTAGLGMTGVPVFNVNNNCSSGSTGIMMARYLILAGYDCALAVGKKQAWLQLVMNHSRL